MRGALIVNGSIAASSGLDVNAGTLARRHRHLAHHADQCRRLAVPGNSIGTIAVAGNLSFAPGSFYVVEVSPTSSDRTVVNGTATLEGTVLSSLQVAGGFQKKLHHPLGRGWGERHLRCTRHRRPADLRHREFGLHAEHRRA